MSRGGWIWGLALAAGCASVPAAPPGARLPEVLAGVPGPILAARAVADLDSGDPEQVASARRILLALPADSLDGWRRRVALEPEGAPGRLDYFAVLADRREPMDGATAPEAVAACLREIERDGPEGRGTMIALEVLRGMGGQASEPLRALASRGDAGSPAARRVLRLLGLPEHGLQAGVP